MTAVDDPSAVSAGDGGIVAASPGRLDAAAVLRRLGHAIVGRDVDEETFRALTTTVETLLAQVEAAPPGSGPS